MLLNLKEQIGYGEDLTIKSEHIESLFISKKSDMAVINMVSGKQIEIKIPLKEDVRFINGLRDFLKK